MQGEQVPERVFCECGVIKFDRKEKKMGGKANLTTKEVADALGVDKNTVRTLIKQGIVDWGTAYRLPGSKRLSYLISPKAFYDATGVKLRD